ncbi:heterokaryon incompatibility protein domain-containing protein [Trichoderma evansii]
MNCVDLRQDADILPLETADGLCSVCQKLNFNWNFACSDCLGNSIFLSHEAHFHIGTVKRLFDKSSCLGCQLILSSLEISRPVPVALMEREIQFTSGFITYWDDNLEKGFFSGRGVSDGAYFEATMTDSRVSSSNSTQIRRIIRDGPRNAEQSPARRKSGIVELRGRTISPIIDINIIKDWMKTCEVHHSYCKMLPPPSSNGNFFRLIDVQEQRIISSANSEKYFALSYVWGSSTIAVLTKDTLSQYSLKGSLKTATLPQTIVDCIQLVNDLGERYLWVDSLCIIQDDYNDKLEQLRTMDNVYRNAALVVVAAAGNDAQAGLCGVKNFTRREWQRKETMHGIPYMTAQPPLREVLERTKWNSRGWTFQEAMLARRILFFTEKQVYWSCRHANWREDMDWEISRGASLSHPLDSFWETQVNQCRTARYCRDVMDFTKREIREQSDAIWAFMGILRLHLSRFPGGFIWGHPLDRLDATLIWDGCSGNHQHTAQYPLSFNNSIQSVEYPSWSWLSTNAPVDFADVCGDRIISEVN